MTLQPVQLNIDNTKSIPSNKQKKVVKPYLEATQAVATENLVKPLPPQGYLIKDNLLTGTKFFFKDIAYDMKCLKNGFNGTANDHQLGKLNDVGLKIGGIGIAAYLASKTTNPKARLMEYIGLGVFLTSMAIYPKIAINGPAKIMHGYDIDKEYIDDQGRKKSVMQDSNYVPYDMYLGRTKDEDIEAIGDRMGIPRDIKNRNDVIREQMRKIATQNNTLWMLSAGFATPAMTALICYGLENYVVAPTMEKHRNEKYNKLIAEMLQKTSQMDLDVASVKENRLSQSVSAFLKNYVGHELPEEEFNNLIKMLGENLDENATEGIREDINKILRDAANPGKESVVINNETLEEMLTSAKNSISKKHKNFESVLVPTKEELENVIKNVINKNDIAEGASVSTDLTSKIREKIGELIQGNIDKANEADREFLSELKDNVVEEISKSIKTQKSAYLSEQGHEKLVNFAKILGEFKENSGVINKCKDFKFEYAPETVLARSYAKFEKVLLKEFGFTLKEMKKMRESDEYTKELLDKKLTEICNDENRYKKVLEKFAKVISEMEINLNGASESESYVKDLINAIENNYNNTARRIANYDAETFKSTIDRLVKEDITSLGNRINTREEVFDFLDGIIEHPYAKYFEDGYGGHRSWNDIPYHDRTKILKYNRAGAGSSKNIEINRIFERYQGVKNSFNRILHSMEIYKRSLAPIESSPFLQGRGTNYIETLFNKAKNALLIATAADHNMKLHTINNPSFYKDYMNAVYQSESGVYLSTKQKGYVTDIAKEALGSDRNLANGNVLERFQFYLTRFRNIVANSTVDFNKSTHVLDGRIRRYYTENEKTRMALFNLVGQSPVDMTKGAAQKEFGTQKWFRIIGGITGTVFGVTLLSQFAFGKLNNPQNLQKQVNDANN